VKKLSGGERRRLYLLSILAAQPNILLLDEPTNDLDVQTLTVLEDYLEAFPGVVVAVSHDRYFLDKMASRVLAVEEDGRVQSYPGGFTEYRAAVENRAREERRAAAPAEKRDKPAGSQRLKFSYKEQRDYETIDDELAALEEELKQVRESQAAQASDYIALQRLQETEAALEARLEEKMERWIYLNDLAERMEGQSPQ